jgi:hypothetical protein
MPQESQYVPPIGQAELDAIIAEAISHHPEARLDMELLSDPQRVANIIAAIARLRPYLVHLVEVIQRKFDCLRVEQSPDRMTYLEAFVFVTAPDITRHFTPRDPTFGAIMSVAVADEMIFRYGKADPRQDIVWKHLVDEVVKLPKDRIIAQAMDVLQQHYDDFDPSTFTFDDAPDPDPTS